MDLSPLGDRAFVARFDYEAQAQRWAEGVRRRKIVGVVDIAVAYTSAAVFLDPDRVDPADLESVLKGIKPVEATRSQGRSISIPVLYDGDDLADIARTVGLTEVEVVHRHSSQAYTVFALGFLPGFAYSGYLPEPLSGIARRSSPRPRVPAGSLAIAGRQTGIYPTESPGGWHLLGRTPFQIVDWERGWFPIRPGDRIQFEPITSSGFEDLRGERLPDDRPCSMGEVGI